METFRKGDFIRLKEFNKWEIRRCIEKDVNVFEIHFIHNSDIIIIECNEKISLADIEPIPINEKMIYTYITILWFVIHSSVAIILLQVYT